MAATKGSSTETIVRAASTGVIGVILMFHSTNYRPTHYALLLAGCSLLALELSAAIAPARGDDGRFDLAEDMGAGGANLAGFGLPESHLSACNGRPAGILNGAGYLGCRDSLRPNGGGYPKETQYKSNRSHVDRPLQLTSLNSPGALSR